MSPHDGLPGRPLTLEEARRLAAELDDPDEWTLTQISELEDGVHAVAVVVLGPTGVLRAAIFDVPDESWRVVGHYAVFDVRFKIYLKSV